jgi:hypothetical protein
MSTKLFSLSLLSVGLAISVGFTPLAKGDILVDTGSPALTQGGAVAVCGTCGPNGKGQSIALKFSLSNSYSITSMEGYLWAGNPGTLTLALYNDSNGLPGNQLYASQFSAVDLGGWSGTSGTNWLVSPGNYWAVFKVNSEQTFFGALEFPAPIVLPSAVLNDYYTSWTSCGGGCGGGLIVSGIATPVPEPETYAMFMAGLGLMGLIARRRKDGQA